MIYKYEIYVIINGIVNVFKKNMYMYSKMWRLDSLLSQQPTYIFKSLVSMV